MSLAYRIRALAAERNAAPCGWDDDRAVSIPERSDEAPPLDIGSDGPTDRPCREDDARWHADEAQALAKLAELTTKRSPWAPACDMEWST